MANCVVCGKWAGVGQNQHHICPERDEINPELQPVTIVRVQTGNIALGVFLGMWAFSITAGIALAIFRALSSV